MSQGIHFHVEVPAFATGNLKPLLHEIRHALSRLLDSGEETIIDLRALPLSSAEASQLEDILGEGELEARLDALGESVIRETQFPGVWLLIHYDADQVIVGKTIEITTIPAILKSQREDMIEAFKQLDNLLNQ